MSTTSKYYSINSYEWLLPTGDASKLLVHYSTADDDQDIQNRKDSSIVIRLSRNLIRDAQLDETNKAKLIVAFLKSKIEGALISANDLPSEMIIMSYDKDFPTDPDKIELRLGDWQSVIIEKTMGFLPS